MGNKGAGCGCYFDRCRTCRFANDVVQKVNIKMTFHRQLVVLIYFWISASAFLNCTVNKTDVKSIATISAIGSAVYTPTVGLDTR